MFSCYERAVFLVREQSRLVSKRIGNIFSRFDADFVRQVAFFHLGNYIIEQRLQDFSMSKAFFVSGDVDAAEVRRAGGEFRARRDRADGFFI